MCLCWCILLLSECCLCLIFFEHSLNVNIPGSNKKRDIIALSYTHLKKRWTPSDTRDVIDKAQIWIYWFIHFNPKIRTHVREEIHIFQDSLNEPLISVSFFPTNSWELRRIRWHEMTSHPRPCGSCDNRPATSKSSLDQTTASCTVAKKQSPKYVYLRTGALMLIKMNNSNQLMRMRVRQRGEIIPKWCIEELFLLLNTRS